MLNAKIVELNPGADKALFGRVIFGVAELTNEVVKRAQEKAKGYFNTGGPSSAPWAPLSDLTRLLKGSDKILVQSGGLRDDIKIRKRGPKTWELYVDNVSATTHEYGNILKVTRRMRAYFHYIGVHLRKETKFITIPARPFLGPAINETIAELPRIERRFLRKWVGV